MVSGAAAQKARAAVRLVLHDRAAGSDRRRTVRVGGTEDCDDGEPYGGLTRDDILDNITLSWLTNTGVSSARLYKEYRGAFFNDYKISVPAAVSVFPEEVYQAPRSWSERAYSKLVHYNQVDRGGHFAAWEQPVLLTADLRAAFKPLRAG